MAAIKLTKPDRHTEGLTSHVHPLLELMHGIETIPSLHHKHIGLPKDLMAHIHPYQNQQEQGAHNLEWNVPQTLAMK